MNYSKYYEDRITKELDKKEVSLWKDFYNNILPERVEQFKKVYRGKPQKLQKAINGSVMLLLLPISVMHVVQQWLSAE